ncbi:uroporphyrinogen-III synthase [Sphingomonas naphthae]|uniref:Uroporphyrinogen-III synthase n=1 Tax=Sphingomonas naphthae TaxID=1813468 RepID=A0ABY7TJ14_9SPHN|nr:uroporphyrinogen-III synthase [Sphingomonas naphthae]WCT73218.1 uroporphyrinogen-III synthase [Sphingomonas naphthae]
MKPLLVLRPEPGAGRTAERAQAMGLEAIVAPLFTVRPLAWTPPGPAAFDALMLTSAQALRHGGDLSAFRALPVYAVGAATGDAARAVGFTQVHAGESDAAALLDRAVADGRGAILHLTGREHRAVIHPATTVTRIAVYAADVVDTLPDVAADALARDAVALLHSPRAARTLAALSGWRGRIAALSPAVAEAAGPGWHSVAVAAAPTDDALLAAAARLCEEGA